MMINLPELARELTSRLTRAFPEWADGPTDVLFLRTEATLKLAEESGEAVGAMLRYNDMTRRAGDRTELALELADVVITAYRCAYVHGIGLDWAIAHKAAIVLARGVKDPR